MGLKKLIKKAGKFAKKAIKVAAPVVVAGLAPAAGPLVTAGASPLLGGGGLIGGGAKPARQFDPQGALSGIAGNLIAGLQTKAECAITGACGSKSGPAAVAPATVAVQSQAAPAMHPLVLLGGLALLAFLIVRK